jgi:hypothetical protein
MNEEELVTFKKKLDFDKNGSNKRKVVPEEDIGDDIEDNSSDQQGSSYVESEDNNSDDSECNGALNLLFVYFMHILSSFFLM